MIFSGGVFQRRRENGASISTVQSRDGHDVHGSPSGPFILTETSQAVQSFTRFAMKTLPCLLALVSLTSLTLRADWTRFRGPNGSGIAAATSEPPLKWSEKEHLSWKTDLPGAGASSPIVVGDKVFVTCFSDVTSGLKRHLVCVDKTSGKILWDKTVAAAQPEDEYEGFLASEHGYASNTPASDGERVYLFFGKSGALAFDLNGEELWQTPLGTGSNSRRWGSAASVMLTKDHVIINAIDEGGAIVGLDRATGKEAWRAPTDGIELAYSTPVLVENGAEEDLVLAVPQEIWGMNPTTGKLRWYATHGLTGNVSPGVVIGGENLYIFGGYPRTASVALKLGGRDDITKNLQWTSNDSSYVPTPVFHEGHLYVVSDQGFATCLEATTGKLVYKERVMDAAAPAAEGGQRRRGGGKPFYASTILADGKLYCTSRKNGTFVLAAKPQFEVLATNIIAGDDTQFNATPAVDGNRLYLRSDKALYCIGN